MKARVKEWIEQRRAEITKDMALRKLRSIQPSQERSVDYPGLTEQEVIEQLKEYITQSPTKIVKERDQKEIDDLESTSEIDRPAPTGGGGPGTRVR